MASDSPCLIARGTAQRVEGTAPQRFVYEMDVFDAGVSTFHLGGGDLVSHAVKAFAVDATRPDFRLVGVHPAKDTIVGENGTGIYAGRTGRLQMSGWHGVSKFPQQVTFEDFFLIELNPAS